MEKATRVPIMAKPIMVMVAASNDSFTWLHGSAAGASASWFGGAPFFTMAITNANPTPK